MKKDALGLSQLIADIKLTLQARYDEPIWVIAEINDMNQNRSGHCYLELIEKDSVSDKLKAKARATIWSFTFRTLKPYFETTTGETLRAGLKVLLKVSVEFHEVFGFSFNVQDIDPGYTLGDLAQKRIETIKKLENDGVIDLNKSIPMASVPQRIAIISSETAAGYGDFINQLNSNGYNIKFQTKLFPAIMQGEKAGESIIQAFNLIFETIDNFDVVVLIRGGGAKSDLSCFDDYETAFFITQFPLPVITGIGHERDDTVADKVAHTKLKTPTAVAEFLVDKLVGFFQTLELLSDQLNDTVLYKFQEKEDKLNELSFALADTTKNIIHQNEIRINTNTVKLKSVINTFGKAKEHKLSVFMQSLKLLAQNKLNQEQYLLGFRQEKIKNRISNYYKNRQISLSVLETKLEDVNPQRILKKGYAIVKQNNNVVTDAGKIIKNNEVNIILHKGSFKANVTDVEE